MKKTILFFVFTLLTFSSFCQTQKNIINVTGTYSYNPKPTYVAKMNASMSNVYYQEQDMDIEKIKSNYYNKLKSAGVDISKIKENHLSYALKGYQKDGVVLEFTTSDINELQKFLTIYATGITKQEITNTVNLSYEEMAKNSKLAYDDAKKKAELIAKKLGKKLGEIVTYNDHNEREVLDYSYDERYLTKRNYSISVSFEIL